MAKKSTTTIITNKTISNEKDYMLRLKTITDLKAVVYHMASLAEMDTDKISRRIKAAISSEYGKVPGLINLIVAIAHWPSDSSSPNDLTEAQDLITAYLGVDLDLLTDIKQAKGFHSFLTDDHERKECQEPEYETYTMLLGILAKAMKKQPLLIDIKLNESDWNKAEDKAETRVDKEVVAIEEELKRYQEANEPTVQVAA